MARRERPRKGKARTGYSKRLPTGFDGFWAKVEPTGCCWYWMAFRDKLGYGRYMVNKKPMLAHRYGYESLIGPIPEGLVLDHLCRNPACVNPDHLEPVTFQENLRRSPFRDRTYCRYGHDLRIFGRKSKTSGVYCTECAKLRARRKAKENAES